MNGSQASPSSKPRAGIGTKLFVSLFFLFFLGLGSMFVWLVAREAWAGLQTWSWSQADCEMIRSGVRQTDQRGRNTSSFYLDIEYRYRFNGNTYVSIRQKVRPKSFSDYGEVARLVEKYRPGSHAICYINPAAPDEAVLERGSLWFPLLVLFPLIFVAIGAIGIYATWKTSASRPAAVSPISDRAVGFSGPKFAMLFFGVFVVLGMVLFYFFSVRPLSRIVSARHWPSVQCTVISSEVKSQRGDHGSTYSVNIFYSYIFEDHEYKANRYDFMGGSSSGSDSKRAIVARYPPRSKAWCYVNPRDPTEAVLERGFTPLMWVGLLPLLFVLLGLVGAISTARKSRARTFSTAISGYDFASSSSLDATAQLNSAAGGSARALKPGMSPGTKLFAAIAIALFWNGIISVFLFQVVKGWRSGSFEWFLALFMIPFVLVGLGLFIAIIYFFLALFNPRPRLTISPEAGRLGETLRVEWEIAGRVAVLKSLRIRLQGREEATYTRGTRTSTDRSVFADLEIASSTVPQEMQSGTGTVTIPAALMHSFSAKHNKILWSVAVRGEIARWPDVNEEFPFTVCPSSKELGKNS
jgi:hypothetical protein